MVEMQIMEPSDRAATGRVSAAAKTRFYRHLIVYLIVNAGLFIINLVTSPANFWFIWPVLGWGVAIAIHAFFTFGPSRHDATVGHP